MIPASQPRCRTAQESRGVERGSVKRKTLKPAAASTRAQSSANSAEWCRVSWAITHDRGDRCALASGHVVGQAPGALGDRPVVQDVGADRVHLAAPAAGAELEHGVEGVVELLASGLARCPRAAGPGTARTAASVSQRPMFAASRRGNLASRLGMREPCERVFGCDHALQRFPAAGMLEGHFGRDLRLTRSIEAQQDERENRRSETGTVRNAGRDSRLVGRRNH